MALSWNIKYTVRGILKTFFLPIGSINILEKYTLLDHGLIGVKLFTLVPVRPWSNNLGGGLGRVKYRQHLFTIRLASVLYHWNLQGRCPIWLQRR